MRYAHILQAVYGQPLMITPAGWRAVHALIRSRLQPETTPDAASEPGDFFHERARYRLDAQRIAWVSVYGPLGKRLAKIEKSCGATDVHDLRAEIQTAAKEARGVFLRFDSPGGSASGIEELATLIAETAASIPVLAYSEDQMCSAAYFLAAGATEIWGSPSAMIGSIGVILPWIDFAEEMALLGLKSDPIVNREGDLKATMARPSLEPQEREYLQNEIVEKLFAAFRGHVEAHRSIAEGAMRGQALWGPDALAANLVDAIGTEEQAYNRLLELTRRI